MKVYIITFSNTTNVGAALQEYALYKFLTRKGHEVKVVNYFPSCMRKKHSVWAEIINSKNIFQMMKGVGALPIKIIRKGKYHYFSRKYIELTTACKNIEEIEKLDQPDIYITGSDQVWNDEIVEMDPGFFLQFKTNARKASYAASAGKDIFSDEYVVSLKRKTENFCAISVRERALKQVFKEAGDNSVRQVLDPVFLLPKESYDEILQRPKIKNYILVYEAGYDERCTFVAQKLANRYKLKVVQINRIKNIYHIDKLYPCTSPTEFLGLMKYADYIVTNSFHAVAISLIFQKQFWVLKFQERFSRLESILEITGLEDRILDSNELCLDNRIDYETVGYRLQGMKEESENFLNYVINWE